MNKKIKVLTIGDNPLATSGVAGVSKMYLEALLKTGKFSVVSLGGTVNPPDLRPIRTEQYGEDWTIFPVKGFGNPDVLRSLIRTEKPDMLWMMGDPRFVVWLLMMEQEIRGLMPIVWHEIWDNFPVPTFNKKYYDSVDVLLPISALTERVNRATGTKTEIHRLAHVVNPEIYKKLPTEEIQNFKNKLFGPNFDKSIFFFCSRNSRRKNTGTLIFWFKEFLDQIGHDKAMLVMHTDPKDSNGPDLEAIVQELGLVNGEIKFSTNNRFSQRDLALWYNSATCTVNIANAEGWGLTTHESLSCETPIICTFTGGLQEQVTNGTDWFGVGLKPATRMIVGSQEIPWIYEDHVNKDDFINALKKMYYMADNERAELGRKGREHVMKNFSFEEFNKRVPELMLDIHERYGSWENRKGYQRTRLTEI